MSAPPSKITQRTGGWLARVDTLALFPLLTLGAWFFGEAALMWLFMAGLPVLILLQTWNRAAPQAVSPPSGSRGRQSLSGRLDDILADCTARGRVTAVFVLDIDDVVLIGGTWGAEVRDEVMQRVRDRLGITLRDRDIVASMGEGRLGIALAPMRRADLDLALNLAERMQIAVCEPISIDGRALHVTATIGFCTMGQAPELNGKALLAAAECALQAARRAETEAVRAFTPEMQSEVETEHQLAAQLQDAFDKGEIRPWFQPQVSADTGQITGFEALARWMHPDLGVLTPAQFLPAVAAASAYPRLGETMLAASLRALQVWDRAGLTVPAVAVNFSLEELRDPRLADRVKFEVDRFDLTPDRLAIEILENVTLRDGEDVVVRNLRALASAGFCLDLDDFGTGHASVSHIARFGARRIKIDRSFVTHVDENPEQKRLVSAILAMAEQLGVETVAEGVETAGEHSTLAQLGCTHIQGFGLARPMPFEDTMGWIAGHNARLAKAEQARRKRLG